MNRAFILVTLYAVLPAQDFGPVREQIVAGIGAEQAPACTVTVWQDGRIAWAEGFGLADRERRIPATADTIYRLASITKPLVATAILHLCDAGKLALDTKVNTLLPGSKLQRDEVSVAHLLSHTSGMPVHYTFFYAGTAPWSLDTAIARYGFSRREPGARFEYSNLGYGILGHLLALRSGSAWDEYLNRAVFAPLGMAHTSARVAKAHERDAAVPYRKDAGGRFQPLPDYDFDHPGASALWSTGADLVRFARMFWEDGAPVLRAASAKAMIQQQATAGPNGRGYGFGWFIETVHGERCFSHTGGMPGVATLLRAFPGRKIAYAVLTNTSDGALRNAVDAHLQRRILQAESRPSRPASRRSETVASERMHGSWVGRIHHHEGPVEVRVQCSQDKVRLWTGPGAGTERGVSEFRIPAPEEWAFSSEMLLGSVPGYFGVPKLEFGLQLIGERIEGICVAKAEGYFALSHRVELTRRD